ncbi:Chromate transporter [Beijerinckiaceae bacterium RH AL1]|nr:Chromate transporter [Beijerinckiaceae bacterium RH CH11]VVB48670.1 Chromate transporter [Beijerinckiaceae bacterium RH AL8]VVC56470.1 Chromate transporter [Beijerinckiaceae bacterium RH AL1]
MTGEGLSSTAATPEPLGGGAAEGQRVGRPGEVLAAFLRLGLTSFGGPVAHLGYFRAEFVERRRWLSDTAYADLVALCQFLPGPSSSQVGLALGLRRAGLLGALAAWCGFTLPSAILLVLFADGLGHLGDVSHAPWLHGLKIAAVAVVAQAVWSMAGSICTDRRRASVALAAACVALLVPSALGQLAAIASGAVVGLCALAPTATAAEDAPAGVGGNRRTAVAALALFAVLLVALPMAAAATGSHAIDLVARFYRSGSLVFGGGHVVLPLLQKEVVAPGFIGNDSFVAGYGAAQAVPGPLFTFAAYLGASMHPAPSGWIGAAVCFGAIYLPSALLLLGALPFWDMLRRRSSVRAAMAGVNAAVVGLLLAALYTPVFTSAIHAPPDAALALATFALLAIWRWPPWLVVVVGALGATILG